MKGEASGSHYTAQAYYSTKVHRSEHSTSYVWETSEISLSNGKVPERWSYSQFTLCSKCAPVNYSSFLVVFNLLCMHMWSGINSFWSLKFERSVSNILGLFRTPLFFHKCYFSRQLLVQQGSPTHTQTSNNTWPWIFLVLLLESESQITPQLQRQYLPASQIKAVVFLLICLRNNKLHHTLIKQINHLHTCNTEECWLHFY